MESPMISSKHTKACRDCGSTDNKFQKHKNYLSGYRSVCTPCMNKQKVSYKAKKRKLLSRYKLMKGCAECGYNKHSAALHFAHYERNTKTFSGNHGMKCDWSKRRIKQELKLCRVLCANCHAIETYNETETY